MKHMNRSHWSIIITACITVAVIITAGISRLKEVAALTAALTEMQSVGMFLRARAGS